MLDKIEVGNSYYNSDNCKVRVLFVDRESVFYLFPDDNTRGFVKYDFALELWSEIPAQKKRYWLWDIKSRYGEIFKASTYMDEKGENINGSSCLYGDRLLKKHENEWIEVQHEL